MVLNDVAELLAVTRAAARIRIKHDVTFRGHPLKFVIENKTVSGVRSAMNVENERIFFLRIKTRRFLQPGLNFFPVEALVGNFFRLGQVQLREEFVVDVGELLAAARFGLTRTNRRCASALKRDRRSSIHRHVARKRVTA